MNKEEWDIKCDKFEDAIYPKMKKLFEDDFSPVQLRAIIRFAKELYKTPQK